MATSFEWISRKYHIVKGSLAKGANGLSSRKRCYICQRSAWSFTKFRGGSKYQSELLTRLDMVGSDLDNFGCRFCHANDRERHLFMYFDRLNIWERFKDASVLHFAPDLPISSKIMGLGMKNYVRADLFPNSPDIQRIDCTNIPYGGGEFDMVIANHVLEHVPDHQRALAEIFRVLRSGGMAILQTPYSRLLFKNFEDLAIDTDDGRRFFYGQEDHVRVFGQSQFFESIRKAGFHLEVVEHSRFFDDHDAFHYGVNKHEPFLLITKP